MEPKDALSFAAALAVVVGSVVGLRARFSPAGRRRASARRQVRREVRARLRQSTTTHPLAARTVWISALFIVLSFGLLRTVLENGIEFDSSSPGLWIPLFFLGLSGWSLVISAVPLVRGFVDHNQRRSFDGVVMDRIRDEYEVGGGEGSCTVEAFYLVVSGATAPDRAYRVTWKTMAQYREGDRVTMTVAPRSGYVYEIRSRSS